VQNVVTSTATSIVSNVTTVLATIAAMVALDWRLAVFSLALLPFFIWLTRRVGRERRRITTERQGRLADMSSLVEESLSVSGILLGKTMGRAPELAERFERESEQLADLEVRSRMAGRWRMASVQMAFSVMPALVYWFFPLQSLLSVGLDIQTSLALFHRIFEYLDLEIDVAERPDAVTLPPGRVLGEVRFEGVRFGYDPEAPPTLEAIDLTVPAGARVAIVGETGSGKTTLGYLVARLYDASAGRVTIDGVDVRDLSFASLAATVGIVSQETYLFHATIRENLRFARPDATDAELEAAARAAQIHGLIASLPDGYDTVVGERGYRFSGGEKQRIAIARTVLRNPPVLVLDEATSALDNETERAVQEALDRLSEGRTTIAIAHRLSTVRDADEIVVLDRGRVAERGTHDDLLARGGRYAALAARDGDSAPPAPQLVVA
jgi:ATP-binding cassette subfamily B protein